MQEKTPLSILALLGMTSGLLFMTELSAHTPNCDVLNNDPQHTSQLAAGSLYDKHRGGCSGSSSPSRKPKEKQPYYYKQQQQQQNNVTQATPPPTPAANQAEQDEQLKKLMAQNITYHDMTEEELLSQLNDNAKAIYNSLNDEGKAIARQIASARCDGTNECRGRGACATEDHDCAGKNDCKGTSKCAVSDANLAVKLAEEVMAKKRANATK